MLALTITYDQVLSAGCPCNVSLTRVVKTTFSGFAATRFNLNMLQTLNEIKQQGLIM